MFAKPYSFFISVTYEADRLRLLAANASFECLSTGKWNEKADYGHCTKILDELSKRDAKLEMRNHHIAILQFSGSLVSLTLLALTLYIFVSFR